MLNLTGTLPRFHRLRLAPPRQPRNRPGGQGRINMVKPENSVSVSTSLYNPIHHDISIVTRMICCFAHDPTFRLTAALEADGVFFTAGFAMAFEAAAAGPACPCAGRVALISCEILPAL